MEYLTGTVVFLDKNCLILENQIKEGTLIFIHKNDKYLKAQEYKVFIHEDIRVENSSIFIKKYGFLDKNTLLLFKFFLEIKGIGPKIASAILENPIDELSNAIIQNDILKLVSYPSLKKYVSEILKLSRSEKYKDLFPLISKNASKLMCDKYRELLKVLKEMDIDPEKSKRILDSINIHDKSEGEIIRDVMSRLNEF